MPVIDKETLFADAATICVGLTTRELFWAFIAAVALARIPKRVHCFLSDVHNVWHEMTETPKQENPHASN